MIAYPNRIVIISSRNIIIINIRISIYYRCTAISFLKFFEDNIEDTVHSLRAGVVFRILTVEFHIHHRRKHAPSSVHMFYEIFSLSLALRIITHEMISSYLHISAMCLIPITFEILIYMAAAFRSFYERKRDPFRFEAFPVYILLIRRNIHTSHRISVVFIRLRFSRKPIQLSP